MVTASLRRQGSNAAEVAETGASFWELLRKLNVPVLPNTAGCMTIQEAVTTAQMAREVFDTPWIKLELIGDDYTLQPDTLNLVEAASILIKDGFQVLPYCTEDLVLCQRLVDVGCQAVMPWAAPIGTGRGPANPYAMQTLRERLNVPLIVDAGLGRPSHACTVMEWGFDGVLLNTAVALSEDPVRMAGAFADATQAGRDGYLRRRHGRANRRPTQHPRFGHTVLVPRLIRDIQALADRIVHHHSATFGARLHHDANSVELGPQPTPPAQRSEAAYLAALHACSQLGFIAVDAECLAQAWQRQTERTHHFDATHWPDDPQDFGLAGADPDQAFPACPRVGLVRRAAQRPNGWARMARAGVPTVQLRFKATTRPPSSVKCKRR